MDMRGLANQITEDISLSASGDNTVISANTGKRFAITDIYMQAASDVNIIIKSGANNLTGAVPFATATTLEKIWQAQGERCVFKTRAVNEAFIVNLSGNVAVTGWVTYLEVDQ